MRVLARPLAFLVVVLGPLSIPIPADAGWSADAVTVLASTAHLEPVVACSDGAGGTYVVWQQAAAAGVAGSLRAQHLLATGDVDPTWPATGAPVSSVDAVRVRVGVIADGLGGMFAWWMEGRTAFFSRLTASGAVAPGWTARGLSFGDLALHQAEPDVVADGAHGIHAAWVVDDWPHPTDPYRLRVLHLGPDGQAAAGWSGDPIRTISAGVGGLSLETAPCLASAPDGGVFVAWTLWTEDPTALPGGHQLLRLGPDGSAAAGWSPQGMTVRTYPLDAYEFLQFVDPDWLPWFVWTGSLAIAPDGTGGVFLYSWDPRVAYGGGVVQALLDRRGPDGARDPAWPANGVITGWTSLPLLEYDRPLLCQDEAGNVLAGSPISYTDAPSITHYQNYRPGGSPDHGLTFEVGSRGHELLRDGAGGVFVADFWPDGPTSIWGPVAYLSVGHLGADAVGLLGEYHDVPPAVRWYGDIALASTGDGGAVFFWSQERERFGLFARRFSAAGEVVGVEPATAPVALALRGLRWSAGRGVSARVSLTGGPATLELFDLAGRRVARERLGDDARGEREVTLAGTGRLEAGLFFARLTAREGERRGRVIVMP